MPPLEDRRLGELAHVPREELADQLKSGAPLVLSRARMDCEAQGLGPDLLTEREMYFALAGSLGWSGSAKADSGAKERIRFVDRDPNTCRLTAGELFEKLGSPLRSPVRGCEGSTGFSEFLWSAACEKKPARRLGSEAIGERADQSFRALYNRLSHPLQVGLGSFFKHWGLPPGMDPEQIANDTWSLAYGAYWSPTSRNRLLGQATILTLLNCIARRLVRSAARPMPSATGVICLDDVEEPIAPDPIPGAGDANAGRIIERCLHLLPPKCRLVAYMYFVQGLTNSEIARRLHAERTAVSNHLNKAKQRVRQLIECEADELPIR